MNTDQQLLSRYLDTKDEAAFDALVGRHAAMVYATARRLCADEAADVTQAVFVVLFRKAESLRRMTSLAGWLYETTRLCSSNARKLAGRRRHHETRAAMEKAEAASGPNLEASVLAALDDALRSLPVDAREAVVMRYLQDRTPDEVANALGITPAAAGKRTTRAVEQLRDRFARRGVAVPVASLISILVGQSMIGVPAAVAGTVSIALLASPVAAPASLAAVGGSGVVWKIVAGCAALFVVAITSTLIVLAQWDGAAPAGNATPATSVPTVSLNPTVSTPAEEASVAGLSSFARFTTLVDAAVLPELAAVSEAVPGQSPLRQATAAAVFDVLRKADATGRVVRHDTSMTRDYTSARYRQRPSSMHMSQFWDDFRHGGRLYTVGFTWSQSVGFRWVDDQSLELKLADPAVETFLQEYGTEPRVRRSDKIAVDWSGSLAPGEVLLVTHDYGPMREHHFAVVTVFQIYRGTVAQLERMRGIRDGSYWLRLGPDGARKLADGAIAWAGGRKLVEQEVPATWTAKLDNGATVRLLAIGRPKRWPFCWWDAGGRPIDKDWTGYPVGLDAEKGVALGYEGLARDRTGDTFTIPPNDKSVDVWVGNGPWHEQEIGVGEDVVLGDGYLRFVSADQGGGTMVALIKGDLGPEFDVYVDCVTTTGERINSEQDRSVALVTTRSKRWDREDENLWVEGKQVARYILRWQRRQKATFTGFADVPVDPPAAIP